MKKIVSFISLLLALTLALSACGSTGSVSASESVPAESSSIPASESVSEPAAPVLPDAINVLTLKGPTGIGLAAMMHEAPAGYAFTVAASTDEAVAAVASGSVDIAAVPTNLAANLYAKTKGNVQMIAISTYGTLYIVENGDTVHSAADLRGKTIYASGQGANPEYILNYILEKNGLTPGTDVTVDYRSEHAEVATLLATEAGAIGLLPEPNVTATLLQNADARIALDLTEEWNAVSDGSALVMGCYVVRAEFAKQYPDAVADFLMRAAASAAAATESEESTAAVAQYCEELGIIPKAAVAKKAIPNCNFTFISGAELQPAMEGYFGVLYAANPASIGGALPDEAFYYAP